jgi:tetratricopeptide (TPR) repeat protein
LHNIGAVYASVGDRQRALDHFRQALPIMQEVGDRVGERVTRFNLALLYQALSGSDTAVIEQEQALE